MKRRTLGRTGLQVSEIGYGTWGIGNTSWIGADKRSSVQALIAAHDAGINFFDTAWVYGHGDAERLLGSVFGTSRDVIFASKVPPLNGAWPAIPGTRLSDVFPSRHVFEYLRKSLNNLHREAIDLYQFHVWNDEWCNDPKWPQLIDRLRRSGAVRFIGLSINDHQPENAIAALESGLIDTVQVIYNIFDQSPEDRLFPYCAAHGIGVIARVPFDEGGLTGQIRPDSTFPEGDFRNRYFEGNRKREVWERVQAIAEDLATSADQLPGIALRFCLSQPAVTTVIPGMRRAAHVLLNATASEQGPLSEEALQRLHAHRWVRNYYPPPVLRPRPPEPQMQHSSTLRSRIRSILRPPETPTSD